MDQDNALLLPGRQALDVQPLPGDLQGAIRNIQTHDLLKSLILQEHFEQSPLTATEVEHPLRATAMKHGHDSAQALLMQVDTLLNDLLLSDSGLLYRLLIGAVLGDQACDGILGQVSLVFQVTIGNLLALRMCFQPALAVSQ